MRATAALLALIFVAARVIRGGEPRCNPRPSQCAYYFADGAFGAAYSALQEGTLGFGAPSIISAACSRENWKRWETCRSSCPLQLVITSPTELRTELCIQDGEFTPPEPMQHLFEAHPLNGVELDIVAAGTPGDADSQQGCAPTDFSAQDYRGKIVLARRGECFFFQKFANVQGAGGAAGLMVNTVSNNRLWQQRLAMTGPSGGFKALAVGLLPRHFGELVLEALEAGRRLRGMMRVACPDGAVQPANSTDDGCPDTRLRGFCGGASATEDLLCVGCPLEMTLTDTTDVSESFCLYGNQLFPRKDQNNIRTAGGRWDRLDFAYAEHPGGGCEAAHFAGLEGMAVAMPAPDNCLSFRQVRMAEKAGVTAFISVAQGGATAAAMVEGVSHFTGIPVHSLHPEDNTRLIAHASAGVKRFTAGGAAATVLRSSFAPGAAPTLRPARAPTEAPTSVGELIIESQASFQVTSLLVAAWVAIVVFAAVLLALALRSRLRPRRRVAAERGRCVLGLKAASSALSLSLLVMTVSVACGLSYLAGVESVDDAMEGASQSLDKCHITSSATVFALSNTVVGAVIASVMRELFNFIEAGEREASTTASLYAFYNGTWDSFEEIYPILVAQQLGPGEGEWGGVWAGGVHTLQGFFANPWAKTADPAESGAGPSLSVTNNGHRANSSLYMYNPESDLNEYWAPLTRSEWDFSRMVGRYFGDPLGPVEGRPRGHMTWVSHQHDLATLVWPEVSHSISILTPLYAGGRLQGTAEMYGDLSKAVFAALGKVGWAQNLTVMVWERISACMVFTSKGVTRQVSLVLGGADGGATSGAVQLEQAHFPEVNALANYMRRTTGNVSGPVTGEFEQSEEFVPHDFTVFRFDFEDGVQDVGGQLLGAELRGPCGAPGCIGPGRGGGFALQLDGAAALEVGWNLSADVPEVARMREEGHLLYQHSCYAFGGSCVDEGDCPRGRCNCPGRAGCGARSVARFSAAEGKWLPVLRAPLSAPVTIAVWMRPAAPIAPDALPSPADAPRLLSDAALTAAHIRWFANGVLYLRTTGGTYGCLTAPIAGGPPVGAWTHLAAVVDGWAGTCSVYVNGSLHSTAAMRNAAAHRGTGEPVLIGQHFNGSLDNFLVFANTMNEREVRLLMNSPGGEGRNVPVPKVWEAAVANVVNDGAMRSGVDWVLGVLIPREDVMREVDSSRERLAEALSEQDERTRHILVGHFIEVLFVVLAIALGSIICFILFNGQITAPFEQLAAAMRDVAVLRTDHFSSAPARIAEIAAMNAAMEQLVTNMQQYRSFLPPMVLHGLDTGDVAREQPPRGKVAICFTDIVGSTKLWEADPGAMDEALEKHNAVVRKGLVKLQGYEVKTIGDSFMSSWEDPADAVVFAVQLQEGLLQVQWPACPEFDRVSAAWRAQTSADGARLWGGLTVRVGICYGEAADEVNPMTDRTDYRGRVVNYAARLESAALTGAVCVSGECYAAASGDPRLRDVVWRQQTAVALKGIGTVACWLVVPATLRQRLDAGPQLPATPANNPLQLQPLEEQRWESLRLAESDYKSSAGSARSPDVDWAARSPEAKPVAAQRKVSMLFTLRRTAFESASGAVAAVCVTAGAGDALQRSVEWCLASAGRTQGKVGTLLGPQGQVTWNVIAPCVSCVQNMVCFAGLKGSYPLTIGGAAGPARHGHVGSSKQRFHVVLGLAPTLATALVGAATNLCTGCLLAFVPDTPPSVRSALRPVDRWRVPSEGDPAAAVQSPRNKVRCGSLLRQFEVGIAVTVEEYVQQSPSVEDSPNGSPFQLVESVTDSGATRRPTPLADRYRELFMGALTRGCTESLADLEALSAEDPADSVLEVVVRALRSHCRQQPGGAAARIVAPFVVLHGSLPPLQPGGPLCQPLVPPLSDAVPGDLELENVS